MTFKRQDASIKKAAAIWFLLLSMSLFAGCTLKRGAVRPEVHVPERTGVFIADLYRQALFFNSVTLSGRLKLAVRTKRYPSVKVRAWFLSTDGCSFMRVKGFAPFGITVFDLLAKGTKAWIFLPRSGQVLEGSRFFTQYGSISVKAALRSIEMLLNPWSPARYLDLRPVKCEDVHSGLSCLEGLFLDNHLVFEYNRYDLMPKRFYSRDMRVFFSRTLDKPFVYPKEAVFEFDRGGIKGRITFSSVERTLLLPGSSLFDESYFLKLEKGRKITR